jgi:hypothetical protein
MADTGINYNNSVGTFKVGLSPFAQDMIVGFGLGLFGYYIGSAIYASIAAFVEEEIEDSCWPYRRYLSKWHLCNNLSEGQRNHMVMHLSESFEERYNRYFDYAFNLTDALLTGLFTGLSNSLFGALKPVGIFGNPLLVRAFAGAFSFVGWIAQTQAYSTWLRYNGHEKQANDALSDTQAIFKTAAAAGIISFATYTTSKELSAFLTGIGVALTTASTRTGYPNDPEGDPIWAWYLEITKPRPSLTPVCHYNTICPPN